MKLNRLHAVLIALMLSCLFISLIFYPRRSTQAASTTSYGYGYNIGGISTDSVDSIAKDQSGNIYMLGYFSDTVDLDPTSGTDMHTSNGGTDIFLTKLNNDGSYAYSYSWGNATTDSDSSIAIDGNGEVYVTGQFNETVDFDPTAGTDEHTSNGDYDIFVTKIHANGTYDRTFTLGGIYGDYSRSLAFDSTNALYITGTFQQSIDFDPSGGTDVHAAIAGNDAFLTKILSDGSYGYTYTWGGATQESSTSLAVDGNNTIYVGGYYGDSVDFDPTSGTDTHVSNGGLDGFLMKFNADGSYAYTYTIGNANDDEVYGITTDSQGAVYLTGWFGDTVDLDPTGGVDNFTSHGQSDSFLTKIMPDGTYGYSRAVGGNNYDNGYSVITDSGNNVYMVGNFEETVDLDPTAGTDIQTAGGGDDVFVSKFSSDGTYLASYTFGGTRTVGDYFYANTDRAIVIDAANSIYFAGSVIGVADFNPFAEADIHTAGANDGNPDGYLIKLLQTEVSSSGSSSSTSSQSTNSTPGPFVCTAFPPFGSPFLFQANVSSNSAQLYFSPVRSPVSFYSVSYGEKENSFLFGDIWDQGSSTGVLSRKIGSLRPNTTYFFRVAGGNICTLGTYGNTLKIKTQPKWSKSIKKVYAK